MTTADLLRRLADHAEKAHDEGCFACEGDCAMLRDAQKARLFANVLDDYAKRQHDVLTIGE